VDLFLESAIYKEVLRLSRLAFSARVRRGSIVTKMGLILCDRRVRVPSRPDEGHRNAILP